MTGNRIKPHGVMAFSPGHSDSFAQHRGPLILEQLQGEAWVEVGRYETPDGAASALDELTTEGVHASRLRISPLPHTKRRRWRFWAK